MLSKKSLLLNTLYTFNNPTTYRGSIMSNLSVFNVTKMSKSIRVERPYNPILDTDGYKYGQWRVIPNTAIKGMAYVESRGGKYDRIVMTKLQYILQQYLDKPITRAMIDEAKGLLAAHVYDGDGSTFNIEMWEYILEKYNGRLPIVIKALREGSVVKTRNVIMTIYVEDPKCISLLTYFEDVLLRIWAPITTATKSFHIKEAILTFARKSSQFPVDNLFTDYYKTGIPSPNLYKFIDFGARGATCYEHSAICGSSHTDSFLGTDTTNGVLLDREHYGEFCSGTTINAAEHSTITLKGRAGELGQYLKYIETYGGQLVFACVSDAYDIKRAVLEMWGGELRELVIAMGAILVVRPDSGCPVQMPYDVIQWLDSRFGHTVLDNGYKLLNHVRVIQGDGVDDVAINLLIELLDAGKWSSDNITWGSGGWLHSGQTRDTQKFAYKLCWMNIGGESIEVYKDPITDSGKVSKRGIITLIESDGEYTTLQQLDEEVIYDPSLLPDTEALEVVYDYGYVAVAYTKREIRERLETFLQI